jgi:NADH-quinone oxidoreductase subunit L
MAFVLIVLAIGSVFAGYIGVPAVLGGSNHIEHYLAPSFAAPGIDAGGDRGASPAEARADLASEGGHEPEAAGSSEPGNHGAADHAGEGLLMAVSTGGALAGIGIAFYFFLRNRQASDRIAASVAVVHRLLLNKYYVDEIYDAAIVQPIRGFSDRVLWKVVDAGIIDGAVNGAGTVVSGWSVILRRLQTGSIRAYALSILVGAVVILGYYVWR